MATKKATTAVEGTAVVWTFGNGNVIEGDLTKFSDEIRTQLALHGLRQKGSDAYAGNMDADEAEAACKRVIEQLAAGEWKATREGTGAPRTTLLAEALMRLAQAAGKEVSLEDAVATIDALPDEGDEGISKKSLRADPAVKAMMAKIRSERAEAELAKNPSDVSALFG